MSSPDSVKPNSLEINKASSPLKQLDNSYDSRESPRDPDQQKTDPTVKKVKKAVRKQSAQQNPEDPAKDNADLEKTDNLNPEAQDQADKKKKKKKAKKTEENPEDQGSNVTANFSKQSTERKVPENSETNQQTQKETEQENNATKPKKTKKKAPVITEDANEAAEVPQEEKPKTVKKKVTERKDEVKAESPVNGGNNKLVKKNSDPAAQKGAKADKPKELQKIENIKPQTKQGSRSTKNIEVAEPTVTKSALVNALVSPKANGKNKKNTNIAENERLSKNTWNTQAKEDEEVFVPVGKAAALKKSPTQEELSAASPKAKLGPIRSKIETGLSTLRPASKTVDVSTVSFAATTRNNKSVRSPDNAGLRRGYDANGQKSYADMSGTQKSYMLEKLDTQAESRKKNSNNKKEKPRMRSFDAGKTDKINSEDTFEARNRMWQVRKAEKLMEEEKKKSREQNDACTFNPQLVTRRFAPLDVSTTSVYDRGLEWTQKVKSAVQAKGDLLLEEKKKADPKKPRIKSITGPTEIRSSKVYIEGFTGPQFGVPKTMNVPSYSQEPLKFSGNLEQKISEINDVYESVSAALKKKSANTKTGFKEAPKSSYGEVKSVSRISVSSQKERGKVEAVVVNKGDDQRMNTLKQMLNLNQKEKKVQEQNADYFGGKEDEKERIVPKSGQRVEIKNNRYVIVDENAEC